MAGWRSHIGFQSIALDARFSVFELALLGDRGGGKSQTLLADYAIGIDDGWREAAEDGTPIPGSESSVFRGPWRGVIFRRHFNDLNSLIDESRLVYYQLFGDRADGGGGGAHYLDGDKKWLFFDAKGKPIDASLQFFHMEHDSDVEGWVGQNMQFAGFDELPQWPNPRPYLMMMASLRAGGAPGLPIRIRSTGNPGGPGIAWLKERFQIPDATKDVVRKRSGVPIVWRDPRTGTELVRTFLLSLREENTTLLQNDPFYEARIMASSEGDPEREKAWVHADFSAMYGQYFKIFNPAVHRFDPRNVWPDGVAPANCKVQGSLDYGENRPTSFGLWVCDETGTHYRVAEYYKAGEYSSYHAGAIRDLCLRCPYTGGRMPSVVWADSQIWYTRAAAHASAMDRTVADIFKRETGLRLVPAAKGPGSRVRGWRWLKDLLAWRNDDAGTVIRKPKLYYTADCHEFEREIRNAIYSEVGDREDIDKGCDDHCLDETNYYVTGAYKGRMSAQFQDPAIGITMGEIMERQDGFEKRRPRRYGIMVGSGSVVKQVEYA